MQTYSNKKETDEHLFKRQHFSRIKKKSKYITFSPLLNQKQKEQNNPTSSKQINLSIKQVKIVVYIIITFTRFTVLANQFRKRLWL